MECSIKEWPAFTVVGLFYRGKNDQGQIPSLWGELNARAHTIPHRPGAAFGVIDNFDMEQGIFDYVAGFEAAPGAENSVPDGMVLKTVPAQRYAVFDTTLAELMPTIGRIYNEWMPTSGFRRTSGAEFEFYGPEFDPSVPGAIMQLFIPIEDAA